MIIRLLFFFLGLCHAVHATKYVVKVGDTPVTIIREHRGKGKNFVHVHQNETTALKAARAIIKAQGGSLLTLVHPGGGRNIVFHLHQQRYEFDPNRIFTPIGIQKTLTEWSHYTPEAAAEVAKLAEKIKALLPDGKVIAVHNNETYSLRDYLPGANLAKDARSMHVNKQHYFRNFYVVTQQQDFMRLKQLNFNSIWQALNASDDGSLSIFLADREYVNVEAGYDQLTAQINMLRRA